MSTPVQRQYRDLKAQNPDSILFFRLGDFYELFYEDALIGSKVLGITLTARHKGTDNEMPMCGFPYHAHAEYLETLIENGYKVAIAEQFETEDKKIIRQVERVITPGTTLESGNLDTDQNNYLAAIDIEVKKNSYALAYIDLSTGEFRACLLNNEISFFDEIYKINPKEILCSNTLFQDEDFTKKLPKTLLTPRSFTSNKKAKANLDNHFSPNHLSISGIDKLNAVLIASSAILEYCQETQSSELGNLNSINYYHPGRYMVLDTQTFNHLEIFHGNDPSNPHNTLFSVFEKPKTAMGGRRLRQWCLRPLLNVTQINERLEIVEKLTTTPSIQQEIISQLEQIPDIERLIGRLANNRGNARDLAYIRQALSVFPLFKQSIKIFDNPTFNKKLEALEALSPLFEILDQALVDLPPLEITQGGMIQTGYNDRLDELRILQKDSKIWLENFLEEIKIETGLQNVRIKYSKNFGFCLEVSKAQAEKAPEDWIRRQTLVNAERFTTERLSEYEQKTLSAESESFTLEHELFLKLRDQFMSHIPNLQESAWLVGQVDALCTFSRTAQTYRWNRPKIEETDSVLNIKAGRHPVVEAQDHTNFIANDLKMSAKQSRFHLISGPNMAGKSTFLRQNALIIFLGQIGSFVPASEAEWSIVDRIFTRVGASDNLAAGKSTFFVEMTETATILHQSTEQSFIILDEIGRGTSTFDGISLAWAITEHLHDKIKAQTLFATHYHELIDLVEELKAAQNFHVSVSQNKNGIVFLRQIKPGGIADSFGIEVAKLAGIPETVIKEARNVLSRLESENLLSGKPNLFALTPKETIIEIEKESEIEKFVETVNPDDLSPKEALEILYKIKNIEK